MAYFPTKTAAVVAFAAFFAVAGCVSDLDEAEPGTSGSVATVTSDDPGTSEDPVTSEDPGTSDDPVSMVMPDVLGTTLDVALSNIERTGVEGEVEIVGGGTFGVVVESNWQVCEQSPAAGETVTGSPQLTVERDCDSGAAEPEESEQPPEEPENTQPESTEPAEPEVPPVLTVDNSNELAALLEGPSCGDDAIGAFASQNSDRTIQFDGHISNFANHDNFDTRFDILLNTGDFSETTLAGIQNGPSFKFEDVNIRELNLIGPDVPDVIGMGDNVTVMASITGWNPDICLFFLDPVSTSVR
jgi:hypothetical protein